MATGVKPKASPQTQILSLLLSIAKLKPRKTPRQMESARNRRFWHRANRPVGRTININRFVRDLIAEGGTPHMLLAPPLRVRVETRTSTSREILSQRNDKLSKINAAFKRRHHNSTVRANGLRQSTSAAGI